MSAVIVSSAWYLFSGAVLRWMPIFSGSSRMLSVRRFISMDREAKYSHSSLQTPHNRPQSDNHFFVSCTHHKHILPTTHSKCQEHHRANQPTTFKFGRPTAHTIASSFATCTQLLNHLVKLADTHKTLFHLVQPPRTHPPLRLVHKSCTQPFLLVVHTYITQKITPSLLWYDHHTDI